ncbi:MAG TPA: hypothetical protein VF326_06960 [Anaerolineaceae bacterium]|jgi:hypothetical protein
MSQLINKIEISFWDITIPLLSESSFVRSSLKRVYQISQRKLIWGSFYVFTWGGIGLVTGIALAQYRILH